MPRALPLRAARISSSEAEAIEAVLAWTCSTAEATVCMLCEICVAAEETVWELWRDMAPSRFLDDIPASCREERAPRRPAGGRQLGLFDQGFD